MRRNLPVTNSEVDFPADRLLVSRTDTKGRIFEAAHATLGELAALQVPHGRSLFEAEADDLNRRVLLVSALLLLCLVMATAACALILRSVQRPTPAEASPWSRMR